MWTCVVRVWRRFVAHTFELVQPGHLHARRCALVVAVCVLLLIQTYPLQNHAVPWQVLNHPGLLVARSMCPWLPFWRLVLTGNHHVENTPRVGVELDKPIGKNEGAHTRTHALCPCTLAPTSTLLYGQGLCRGAGLSLRVLLRSHTARPQRAS